MINSKIFMGSAKLGRAMDWQEWAGKIPFLQFPSHWKVKAVPPFHGAMIRYHIRTDKMPEKEFVSIYLDCHDALGVMGEPYWEVYPVRGDTERCFLNQTGKLLQSIIKAIQCLEEENK